jgi:DNA-binding PadR family transcriptional regulator
MGRLSALRSQGRIVGQLTGNICTAQAVASLFCICKLVAMAPDDLPTRKLRKTGPTLTVLRVLYTAPAEKHHGYELAKHLRSHQSAYAIFRKLEAHGLVTSWWEEVEGRRRRYYRLTGNGIDYCRSLFPSPGHAANGCTLTVTNRRVGGATRSIPTRVAIPDITTAAAATGADWLERLDAARRRARVLHDEFPETLTSGLLRGAAELSDVDFDLARTAAAWFRQHNATGLTPRQVPIAGLHAKWLDRNMRIVTGLSGRTELGLVTRPSRIHFSYVDGGCIRQGNRRRDSVALDEPHQPPGYLPQVILITENKDSALFFPEIADGIVIEGNGNAAIRLAKIPWIVACPHILARHPRPTPQHRYRC